MIEKKRSGREYLNRPLPAPKAGQKLPFNNGKLLKIQARLVEQSLQNAPAIGTLNGTLPQREVRLNLDGLAGHATTFVS
jgi:hypothetical protein